jgi:uncharacterized membrane protein YphA (DoxX/SURF4 family)
MVGYGFMEHGYAKLARGPDDFGYETDLLYLAGLAALVLGGSGPYALDQLLIRRSGSKSPS